jgi:hypothetical protein
MTNPNSPRMYSGPFIGHWYLATSLNKLKPTKPRLSERTAVHRLLMWFSLGLVGLTGFSL